MSSRLRWWVGLLVAGHLLVTLWFAAFNPLGEAPDEADHWAYVVHLARERSLPQGPRVTQSKHPPLYHASAAAISLLAEPANDFLRANPDVQLTPAPDWSPNFFIHTAQEQWPWQGGVLSFHLARFWSVLLNTLTLLACVGLVRSALPGAPAVLLAAVGMLAFLPEFAFIGGAVNNDNAAALFGTLAVWGGIAIYQAGGQLRAGWWTPLALGAGLLAKTSTLGLWPAVGLAILLGAARTESGRLDRRALVGRAPHWIGQGLLVFGGALAIASPWLLRNQRLYGDPLGMALVRETIDMRTTPWRWADTNWLLNGWFHSFWGKFGGAGHIPMAEPIYTVLAIVSALAIAGLVRTIIGATKERTVLLLLATAALGMAAGVWQYSLTALGTDQARLLFPAIGPLVSLFAVGLLAWAPRFNRMQVAGGWVVLMTILVLYSMAGVVRPAFAPPAPVANLPDDAMPPAAPIHLGDLTLAGWTPDPTEPTLYWRAQEMPQEDWRTILRVVAMDGTLIWEWRRSPGAGRWSTDRWPKKTMVADRYVISWPEWAADGAYLVEVGLYPYDGDPVLPAGAEHPFAPLGMIRKGPP